MEKAAVIDVGTNSTIMLVAGLGLDGLKRDFEMSLEPRLGQGLHDTGRLSREAVERTIAACRELITRSGFTGQVIGTGTQALRAAENRDVFLDMWERDFHSPFYLLSQPEEAAFAYRGAVGGLELPDEHVLIDVGGGSTEMISPNGFSGLEIGAVTLTERFGLEPPIVKDLYDKAFSYVRGLVDNPLKVSTVVGVGGTASTLAAVSLGLRDFDAERVHGSIIRYADFTKLADRMRQLSIPELRALMPFAPNRSEIINAGLLIYRALIPKGADMIISQRGLRWGVCDAVLRGDKIASA